MIDYNSDKYLGAIAIVGMAGRFPGASDIDTYWHNLANGVESIKHFTVNSVYKGKGTANIDAAGFLEGITLFDADYFGYTPREAEIMDPQQRFSLECAVSAMENAGYTSEKYESRVGVYFGSALSTYLIYNLLPNLDLLNNFGALQISNSNEGTALAISYKLNLEGPSIDIYTTCSTSLVAIHQACRALLNYESDMVLAGGVSIDVQQEKGYIYQEGSIYSPDGHCRPFDKDAKGTVGGSGIGIVVLKRLEDALADGDSIDAIIRSSAINNDGANKVNFSAPSVQGQTKVITEALALADINPETISYVETHGTGTVLGDPIEITALSNAYMTATENKGFCAIGSVKSNIGHLNTAAGVAGLIKTVLALKEQKIPPSINYVSPNPQIDFANSPFFVNTQLKNWSAQPNLRRAAVSSFGMGGTNAHVILEQAPIQQKYNKTDEPQLLILSAKTEVALIKMQQELLTHLENNFDLCLADVAYTLQIGRKEHRFRSYIVAMDVKDAVVQLKSNNISIVDIENKSSENVNCGINPSSDNSINFISELIADQAISISMLLATAERWQAGAALNWQQLHEGKSRKRIHLPSYAFQRQHYWIDPKVGTMTVPVSKQQQDIDAVKKINLEDWFYQPSWRRLATLPAVPSQPTSWLCITDDLSWYDGLVNAIQVEEKNLVHRLTHATDYTKLDAQSYSLDIAKTGHLQQLFEEIHVPCEYVINIIYDLRELSTNSKNLLSSESYQIGKAHLCKLHNLAKFLVKLQTDASIRLAVIVDRACNVFDDDSVSASQSLITGLLKSLSQENANIRCAYLDYQGENILSKQSLSLLVKEFAHGLPECVICFRHGVRWGLWFEQTTLLQTASLPPRLGSGKTYMIIGGLGQLGLAVAEKLASTYQAKLVLISRSEFPSEIEWEHLLTPSATLLAKKIETLKNIKSTVGDNSILIVKADITDLAELSAAFTTAEESFGKVDGVIHAASATGDDIFKPVESLTIKDFEYQFNPKVVGLQVLASVIATKNLDFCCLFSSLASVLSGLGYAAYASANAYMDAFVQENKGYIKTTPLISIGWDSWVASDSDNVNANYHNQENIFQEEGCEALLKILNSGLIGQVYVSPTDLFKRTKQWLTHDMLNSLEITADKLPTLHQSSEQIEKQLIAIWQEFLGVDSISVDDNFFDLGGHSLLATQIASRIRKTFDVDFCIAEMFESKTIAELTNIIIENKLAAVDEVELDKLLAEI